MVGCGLWGKSRISEKGRKGGSRIRCRNRIFRAWDASQGHSLASGQDLRHHHSFLIVIPENGLSCLSVHNQVLLQNLTRELTIHSIQKKVVSQLFSDSLVKEAHSQPSWGFLTVTWKGWEDFYFNSYFSYFDPIEQCFQGSRCTGLGASGSSVALTNIKMHDPTTKDSDLVGRRWSPRI